MGGCGFRVNARIFIRIVSILLTRFLAKESYHILPSTVIRIGVSLWKNEISRYHNKRGDCDKN